MMKTNLKTFNKNIKKHRNFLKKNGYLVITNILNKKDLENMEKLILKTAKIYINFNKRKISGLDDPYFNKELIKYDFPIPVSPQTYTPPSLCNSSMLLSNNFKYVFISLIWSSLFKILSILILYII